jgi:hypothetical protein
MAAIPIPARASRLTMGAGLRQDRCDHAREDGAGRRTLAGAALLWLAASPAMASESPWSGAVILQADAALAGAAPGPAGQRFDEAYAPGRRAAIEVQRRTGELGELFITLAQTRAEGEAFSGASGSGGAGATARLSALRAASLELGYRRRLLVFFAGVQPSLSARVGVVRTGAIALLTSQEGSSAATVGLTRASTAALLGADLGLAYQIGRQTEISAEIGLRYTGPLLKDRSAASTGGGGAEGRLSLPVGVRVTTRF